MLWMSKLAKKQVSHQKGFTLLELLMVIAVIGILASIAVPRFQNYNQRARFTEVINAVGPYKTAVEMCATNLGTVNGCNAASNNIPAASGAQGRVSSVNVVNGEITATGDAQFNQGLVATTYVLTPTFNNNGLTWAVGGTCRAVELCQ
ncbi:MAG: pilE [Burkholderiaceae bacterium]|nr:pilE [Burkholderiaceae bacterium]